MFSYDPSMLTESEIFYLQQGDGNENGGGGNMNSMHSASNQNMAGSFAQNSHDGSNMGNQGNQFNSANNSLQGVQVQNFFENSNPNMSGGGGGMNYNGQSVENVAMNSQGQGHLGGNAKNHSLDAMPLGSQGQQGQGHMNANVHADSQTMQQQLSRESTAAWVQGQNTQHQPLPQSQSLCPPVPAGLAQQGLMSQNDNGNMPMKAKEHGGMSWNGGVNNNNMPSQPPGLSTVPMNGMQNMHQMLQSPGPPNVQVPHPPPTPKSNVLHPHSMAKVNQMQMNPGHGQMMQQNAMLPGQGHLPHPPPLTKVERESPQLQVPHISQSQIPPRAKAANRNLMLPQQPQQQQPQQQQQQQQVLQPNQNQMMNMQQGNYANRMYGGHPMTMQQHQLYQQQLMNMQYNGPMNGQGFNPNCQQQVVGQRSPYSKLELSPGCNQVTSSTDVAESRCEPEAPPIENFMDNLNSISAENFMDNINSISQENMNQVYSPTAMSNRSTSQASRYGSALMNTSNMVVNDMSSVMMQLAEENKYLNRRH